jgi:hypothetical protein
MPAGGRTSKAKKFGGRKCHFAMTQAFEGQMAGVSRRNFKFNFGGKKSQPNPRRFMFGGLKARKLRPKSKKPNRI